MANCSALSHAAAAGVSIKANIIDEGRGGMAHGLCIADLPDSPPEELVAHLLWWHLPCLFRGLASHGQPVVGDVFCANIECRPSAYLAILLGTGGLQFTLYVFIYFISYVFACD
jgi:hypothetical protein